ncbi:MAG: hypothetical protein ACYDAQ_11965 [Mycobacteriales bacterium]
MSDAPSGRRRADVVVPPDPGEHRAEPAGSARLRWQRPAAR